MKSYSQKLAMNLDAFFELNKVNKKVSPIYNPYIEEVPVREDTCPGPSALRGRVASSFPCCLHLPSVSTGSPFSVGWTVSECPAIGSRWILNGDLWLRRPLP